MSRERDIQDFPENGIALEPIPDESLEKLSRWAQVHVAARCARRCLQLLDASHFPKGVESVLETLDVIDAAAEAARPLKGLRHPDCSPTREFAEMLGGHRKGNPLALAALAVDDAYGIASVVGDSGRSRWGPEEYRRRKLALVIGQAFQLARQQDAEYKTRLAIHEDVELILQLQATNSWADGTPVPADTFALHCPFETDVSIDGEGILKLRSRINEELIARLAEHPRLLYDLEAREFEELIAKVFDGFGFDVELTAPVKDGGRDVVAIGHAPAQVKYLIECKKYHKSNKIGIGIVQRLHGVVQGEAATFGILATTSSFTTPASGFLSRPNVQWRLGGKDFDGIHEWLTSYDRLRMARRMIGSGFSMTASGLVTPVSALKT